MTTTNLPIYLDAAGTPRTDSRSLAALFGKQPFHVVRDIDALIRSHPDLDGLMFQEVRAFDEKANRVIRSFTMAKDGFALLVMGYTGPTALKFKLAFLRRFNEMEAELRERHAQPTQGSRDDALIAALTVMAQTQTSLMQVMQGWMTKRQPPRFHNNQQ